MLAVRGEHSDTVSRESWQSWQRLHPDARFLEVPDAGHLVPMERPDIVSAAVTDFFATV